jgi:TolB-like protein
VRRALLVALVALAVPGTAAATVVSGSLTGAKLPKKGKGVAAVRAVTIETGAIGGAKRTSSKGAFSLLLAPARYLMFASTTPFRGRAASADGPATRLRVSSKPKRKLKVRAKKRRPKRRRHKAHRSARPGFVDVDYPAIWVKHFDTSAMSVEWRVMGKGMADMLITDLARLARPACATGPVVVEREHLDAVIAEIALSNSPAADPSTAVPQGHLIEHNMIVSGRLRTDGSKVMADATVEDLRSRRTFSTSTADSAGDIFALEQDLAAKLAAIICSPPPPATDVPPPLTCGLARQTCGPGPPAGAPKDYAGSVSGSEVDPITSLSISWSGSVTMAYEDRHASGQGDSPPGDYWYFNPSAGNLHVTLDKPSTDGDKCVWHGEADVPVHTGLGDTSSVRADSEAPEYYLIGGFGPGDQVPFTGAGSDCQGSGTWGLYGMAYLYSVHSQKSGSTSLSGSATQGGGPYTALVTWQWSLGPQY